MNTTAADGVVLKQDVLGRVRTPKARREQLLDEFERSGLSGQKFAQLTGVKYPTFATWVQERRRARQEYPAVPRPKPLRWLEAVVAPGNSGEKSALVLELTGGARLQIQDAPQAALAAALLRALEQPC